MNIKNIISWIFRLTIAVILLQTLHFKFTAHPYSADIFSALGVEPWVRIGIGIFELITATLILLPKTKVIGMATGLGTILGADFSHIFIYLCNNRLNCFYQFSNIAQKRTYFTNPKKIKNEHQNN